jgi:hypothetical protein
VNRKRLKGKWLSSLEKSRLGADIAALAQQLLAAQGSAGPGGGAGHAAGAEGAAQQSQGAAAGAAELR